MLFFFIRAASHRVRGARTSTQAEMSRHLSEVWLIETLTLMFAVSNPSAFEWWCGPLMKDALRHI